MELVLWFLNPLSWALVLIPKVILPRIVCMCVYERGRDIDKNIFILLLERKTRVWFFWMKWEKWHVLFLGRSLQQVVMLLFVFFPQRARAESHSEALGQDTAIGEKQFCSWVLRHHMKDKTRDNQVGLFLKTSFWKLLFE